MAMGGTKEQAMLLGMVVAALVLMAAAAQPSDEGLAVTIYNPSLLVMDIMNDAKDVRVTTETVTIPVAQGEQPLRISVAGYSQPVDVTAHDGDVLVVMPDPADAGSVQAFKIQAAGEEPRPANSVAEEPARPVSVSKPDVRPVSVRP